MCIRVRCRECILLEGCNFTKHRALQGQYCRARFLREDRILIFGVWDECPFLRAVGEDWNPGFCLPWSSSRSGVTSIPFSNPKAKLLTVVYKPPSPYFHYQRDLLSNPLLVTHFPPATQASLLSFTHTPGCTCVPSAWSCSSSRNLHGSLCHLLRSLLQCHLSKEASVISLLKIAHCSRPLFIPLPCFIFLYRVYYHLKYYIFYSFI